MYDRDQILNKFAYRLCYRKFQGMFKGEDKYQKC